jgi:hypothetical protein
MEVHVEVCGAALGMDDRADWHRLNARVAAPAQVQVGLKRVQIIQPPWSIQDLPLEPRDHSFKQSEFDLIQRLIVLVCVILPSGAFTQGGNTLKGEAFIIEPASFFNCIIGTYKRKLPRQRESL